MIINGHNVTSKSGILYTCLACLTNYGKGVLNCSCTLCCNAYWDDSRSGCDDDNDEDIHRCASQPRHEGAKGKYGHLPDGAVSPWRNYHTSIHLRHHCNDFLMENVELRSLRLALIKLSLNLIDLSHAELMFVCLRYEYTKCQNVEAALHSLLSKADE